MESLVPGINRGFHCVTVFRIGAQIYADLRKFYQPYLRESAF